MHTQSLGHQYVGIAVTGASDISTELVNTNQITDYSLIIQPFTLDQFNKFLRCATGLGPSGSDGNIALGGWYFGGAQIAIRRYNCGGPVIEYYSANIRNYPGIINL